MPFFLPNVKVLNMNDIVYLSNEVIEIALQVVIHLQLVDMSEIQTSTWVIVHQKLENKDQKILSIKITY